MIATPEEEVENNRMNNRAKKAKRIFARIPAEETKISPFRLSEMLLKLTGTGFAHPKPKRKSMRVPIGSRCLSGLKLSRPSHLAVGSPIL
jgi:hypothetical protein